MPSPTKHEKEMADLIFSHFSVDGNYLLLSTETYFAIYSLQGKALLLQERAFGGLRSFCNLGTTSALLIVPSGDKPGLDSSPRRPKFWNLASRTVIQELSFDSSVEAIAWNRHYAAFLTNTISLYDLDKITLKASIPCHASCKALVMSLDSDLLIHCGPAEGTVGIYHCAEGRTLSMITAHRSAISQLAVSRDGGLLVSASTAGTILRLWQLPSGELLRSFRMASMATALCCLSFCPKAAYLLALSTAGTVYLYALHTPEEVQVEEDEDDYCKISTTQHRPSSWTDTIWRSETAQALLDTSLHSLATLSAFSSQLLSSSSSSGAGGKPSASAASVGKMDADQRLLRPVLEAGVGEQVCEAVLAYTSEGVQAAQAQTQGMEGSNLSHASSSSAQTQGQQEGGLKLQLLTVTRRGLLRRYEVHLRGAEGAHISPEDEVMVLEHP